MEIKKHPDKDIRNKRLDFSLIGLAVSLALVLIAFTVRGKKGDDLQLEEIEYEEEIVVMENTMQVKKPPPPPPPPELQIVEDEVEIDDDEPDFEDTETDQDTEIEAYEEEDEPTETDEVFEAYAVEKMAEFDGGMAEFAKFIQKNLNYPEAAKQADRTGTVLVRFTVDKKGNTSNYEILTPPLGFGLEDAAIDVIRKSSGLWVPAEWRDQKVNVRFQVPIKFTLY